VVEGARLESGYTGNGIVSSNLIPSATFQKSPRENAQTANIRRIIAPFLRGLVPEIFEKRPVLCFNTSVLSIRLFGGTTCFYVFFLEVFAET
jgi:hypothetical protein